MRLGKCKNLTYFMRVTYFTAEERMSMNKNKKLKDYICHVISFNKYILTFNFKHLTL